MATAVITEAERQSSVANDSRKRKSQIDEIEVDLSLPEPPSKKAKRLLKKGKPLPVKPQSDDEAESEDELPVPKVAGKGGKEEKKAQRSEHGIWIGNLPFTLTRVELFKWFVESSGGAIKEENITRVNLPTSKDRRHANGAEALKQNKGFAYVDFDAEPAAVAALALTETELDGRKVLIKNSNSFEGRPKKENPADSASGANATPTGGRSGGLAATESNKPTSRKIYVGNLSFQTDEDDLRAQFDKCGEIEWVKVATFEDSGKCKGFGWVKFKDPEAASSAVKGFVKIKEEIETEDDFRDGNEEADEQGEKEKEKKFKTRKWWVNRLKGRELKIELAEDDQVRYKKRFGKDAPVGGRKMQGKREPRAHKTDAAGGEKEKGSENKPAFGEKTEDAVKPGYGDAATASYLTGAVVKPQGKKITFD
ncbi:hypothetical protein F5Y06DRAFT_273124 [Hypoxylon sp. FL0890]|nr:hypothetical protein F5Y06DRAFT_273124 [Hypoxylon sp. FL0890]